MGTIGKETSIITYHQLLQTPSVFPFSLRRMVKAWRKVASKVPVAIQVAMFFFGGQKMDPNGGIVVGQNPVQVV